MIRLVNGLIATFHQAINCGQNIYFFDLTRSFLLQFYMRVLSILSIQIA